MGNKILYLFLFLTFLTINSCFASQPYIKGNNKTKIIQSIVPVYDAKCYNGNKCVNFYFFSKKLTQIERLSLSQMYYPTDQTFIEKHIHQKPLLILTSEFNLGSTDCNEKNLRQLTFNFYSTNDFNFHSTATAIPVTFSGKHRPTNFSLSCDFKKGGQVSLSSGDKTVYTPLSIPLSWNFNFKGKLLENKK